MNIASNKNSLLIRYVKANRKTRVTNKRSSVHDGVIEYIMKSNIISCITIQEYMIHKEHRQQ